MHWRIGQRIRVEVLGGQRAGYGEEIVSTVSRQLTADYGRSFSVKSLRHMMRFAEAFPDEALVSTLSRQLAWSHFRELIYLKDPLARDFYAEMGRIERVQGPDGAVPALAGPPRPGAGRPAPADPACGTGGFLLGAYQWLTRTEAPALDRRQKAFLHDIGELNGEPAIDRADALVAEPKQQVDYVLANPPFGKKSSMTITNGDGEEDREALTYERQDFWETTSHPAPAHGQGVKASLDLFWLKDDSLDNLDDLPPPDVLQQEIIEHLEAALSAFRDVAAGLPSFATTAATATTAA